MKKLIAVFKREYLSAVRKKMFIVMTFLLPLLMGGFMYVVIGVASRGLGVKKVAVIDGTGALRETFSKPVVAGDNTPKTSAPVKRPRRASSLLDLQYVDAHSQTDLDAATKPYLSRLSSDDKNVRLDGVFVIPSQALDNSEAMLKYYSRSATDFVSESQLSSMTNEAVQRKRLAGLGMSDTQLDRVMKSLKVDAVQISKSGEQKKGGAQNFVIGFVLTALLFIPSFIYGLEVMRGIIQEKTDRVVEVLISSMSSTQLLVGKILGVAAVGLTQITVWFLMAGIAGTFGAAVASVAGEGVMQLVRPATFVYFAIFFILAFLTYVCIYAIGGAVCNSEKEAQQMIAPITMTMMLPWFLLSIIITNPDSNLAVGMSLAPVFGPLTMYVRTLVAEPPMWHILLSIAVSICTIAAFFWLTAKIFHVGILSYGKRPTIPELWRWLKVA
ncbi:MAG TPA: ABC transporter permease [Thermoanaerobaculia bacterium]